MPGNPEIGLGREALFKTPCPMEKIDKGEFAADNGTLFVRRICRESDNVALKCPIKDVLARQQKEGLPVGERGSVCCYECFGTFELETRGNLLPNPQDPQDN